MNAGLDISVTGASYVTLFGFINISETTISSFIVTVLLCVAGVLLGKNLQKRPGKMQVLVEKGVMMIHNLVLDTMGSHNASWTPFIGTIFLSSICGTLIGMTGFLRSTTADLACVLTWSVMVSVIIWYQNIRRNGFLGWLKGFTEPIVVMTPMNIISEIAQPFAMALRHFGNVAGGGVITSILYAALSMASTALLHAISGTVVIPIVLLAIGIALFVWGRKTNKTARWIFGVVFAGIGFFGAMQFIPFVNQLFYGIPILAFGLPAVFSIYFDLFSGFVQALVFTLLTMVYIYGACPPPEEQEITNGNS